VARGGVGGECNHFVGGLGVALGGHAEASGRHIKYVTKATATTLKLCQLRNTEKERERKEEGAGAGKRNLHIDKTQRKR